MKLSFSESPGACERQLFRRYSSPLFGPRSRISETDLADAREKDRQELEEFYTGFQKVLREIADFSGQVESEIILEVKQRVERMYEQCCGLSGDNSKAIEGLTKLQDMIMQAIALGAEGDATAISELRQEAEARELHRQLLAYPIVCDLLRPEPVIEKDELAATILTADADSVIAALNLFQAEPLKALIDSCQQLLDSANEQGIETGEASERLELLKESLALHLQA